MKKHNFVYIALFCIIPLFNLLGQNREEFNLPDISGYKTLKCDLHLHTVFSDGAVWPSVRVDEAWRMGLDAIAITDHLEWTPNKEDFNLKYNRSYEIAKKKGDLLNIMVIKGAEVTRQMPPGHINAIFLNDVEKMINTDWKESIKAAEAQDAFIFYNHPGWEWQQKDGVSRWYKEHEELFTNGMLDGVELVNQGNYYPEAQKWTQEKKLTVMANTDSHDPAGTEFETFNKERRTFTVVFAKEKSIESIKDALKNQRTVAYWNNHLAGDIKYLKEIFFSSISFDKNSVELYGKNNAYIQIKNNSSITYELKAVNIPDDLQIPKKLTIEAGKTVIFRISANNENMNMSKDYSLPYVVENLYSDPMKGMPVELKISVKFTPKK